MENNQTNERWVTLPGNNSYEISDHGRVKNVRSGKIKKTSISNCGYEVVSLMTEAGKHHCRNYNVHRLVIQAFMGISKLAKGYSTDHINGIKTDNRLSNLEIVKHSENCRRGWALKKALKQRAI